MVRDFTLQKYNELLKSIKSFNICTVVEYLEKNPEEKTIILRHDVDKKPGNALEMAKHENQHGIKSTYYFRTTDEVFKPEIRYAGQNSAFTGNSSG